MRAGFTKRHLLHLANLRADTPWNVQFHEARRLLGTGSTILILGERGTGKTQLATLLAWTAQEEVGFKVRQTTAMPDVTRYSTAMDLFVTVRGTYDADTKTSEREAINRFTKPQLLVVDEVQERGRSDWENRLLTLMVDRRYADMKDTILIANLTPDQAARELGPSIWSRLSENGFLIVADWPSFRESVH